MHGKSRDRGNPLVGNEHDLGAALSGGSGKFQHAGVIAADIEEDEHVLLADVEQVLRPEGLRGGNEAHAGPRHLQVGGEIAGDGPGDAPAGDVDLRACGRPAAPRWRRRRGGPSASASPRGSPSRRWRSVLRMWVSGASADQRSCLAMGFWSWAESSERSSSWRAGKPAKPSFLASRRTEGVETSASRAKSVMLPSPAIG